MGHESVARMRLLDDFRPLPGLRVLVTAGAGGVGAVVARAFHAAGSLVHVCDIDRAAINRLTTETPGITGSMADASVAVDVDLVFDDVLGQLGGLDVLISNATIAGPSGTIEAIENCGWERAIGVNLNSQYYFARRAVPLLKQSQAGPSLISIGSIASRPSCAFRAPYASSKWAMVGLMKSLAIELGPHQVRVNAILSGSLVSRRNDQNAEANPPRRAVDVEDVAALALFLCSPAARNVTGQAVSVGGSLEYF